jgi:uncharacterized protein YxeA
MKTKIILLLVLLIILAVVLFLYKNFDILYKNKTLQNNLLKKESPQNINNFFNQPVKNSLENSFEKPSLNNNGFKGPVGSPFIIGPQSPPPNY